MRNRKPKLYRLFIRFSIVATATMPTLVQATNAPALLTTDSSTEQSWSSSPLSTFVLTQEAIKQSGATHVAEALRLVPGLFVAEQRNGYYSVTFRGLNNLPTNTLAHQSSSKQVLLMINNRVLHDYVFGVTPWHDLSFSVDDISHINVIRGPNSVRYGATAAGGVIQIFTHAPLSSNATKQPNSPKQNVPTVSVEDEDEEDWSVEANSYGGTANTHYFHSALHFKPDDSDWRTRISIHTEQRDRHQATLYSQFTEDDQPIDGAFRADVDLTDNPFDVDTYFSDPERAMQQTSANLQLTYDDEISRAMTLDLGFTKNEHLKVGYWGYGTPMTEFDSRAFHINVAFQFNQLNIHFYSTRQTTQFKDNFNFNTGETYETTTTGLQTQYQVAWHHHQLTLEHMYRGVGFKSERTRSNDGIGGSSHGFLLQDDWQFSDRLRLLLAARYEALGITNRDQFPIQLGLTYQLTHHHQFRALFSQGYQEPYIKAYVRDIRRTLENGLVINNQESADMDLYQVDLLEIGLRGQWFGHTHYELDLWYQQSDGYFSRTVRDFDENTLRTELNNMPTTANQTGFTAALVHHLPNKNGQHFLRYFMTLQRTQQKDYYLDPFTRTTLVTQESTVRSTPRWFGGFVYNCQLIDRINLNVNGYYTDDSVIDIAFYDPAEIAPIRLLNIKVDFAATPHWHYYLNFRNSRDSAEREFFNTDLSRDMVLIGVSFQQNKPSITY